MIWGGNPFEHLVRDLLILGALIGLGIAGLIALAAWLLSHLSIAWI